MLVFIPISTATATAEATEVAGSGMPLLCSHLRVLVASASGGS